MPRFSSSSRERLATAHPELQRLFERVILMFDCTVLEGVRSMDRQLELYREGKSKTLKSNHLKQSDGFAYAVDAVPYPIDWNDFRRMERFGGYVLGIAQELGIPIRWGGLWDRALNEVNTGFVDLPHFELLT